MLLCVARTRFTQVSNLQHIKGEFYYLHVGIDSDGVPQVVMKVKCLDDAPTLSALPDGYNCNGDFKLFQGKKSAVVLEGNCITL